MDRLSKQVNFLHEYINPGTVAEKRRLISKATNEELKTLVEVVYNSQWFIHSQDDKRLLKLCNPIIKYLLKHTKSQKLKPIKASKLRKVLSQNPKCLQCLTTLVLCRILSETFVKVCNE